MRVKGWGEPWENFREEQGWNRLLSGYRVHSLRPFPMVCHSTTSPFLLHVEQMFNPLRLCPSGVSLSTGSLDQQCQPMATCLGPREVSAVAIKSISRSRPMFKCSVSTALCLKFSRGRAEEPARPSLCQAIFVGDLWASSRKLHTLISARQATVPAVPPCLELGREDRRWVAAAWQVLCPMGPGTHWAVA